MIEQSVVETIADRIEQELARVRAKRPELASRISRAEGIIVTHLSCRRARLIRVRVRDDRARFLVNGSEGAVYVVDPVRGSARVRTTTGTGRGATRLPHPPSHPRATRAA